MPLMFEELSSYYAVGYEQTYPNDGKLRWLEVEVTRKGVIVVPSNRAIAAFKSTVDPAPVAIADATRNSGLVEALAAALPVGELPLQLSYVAVARASTDEQAVVLTIGLPASPSRRDEFGLECLVFDEEGRRKVLHQSRRVTLPPSSGGPDAWADVTWRLNLQPGRYQVRVAAQRESTTIAGSVFATITVPRFARDPLSVSGVAVTRVPAAGGAGGDVVADLLPFRPTAARTFARTDRVSAFVRIHQRSDKAPVSVALVMEVTNAAGALVLAAARTMPAASFDKGAAVEHGYDLPAGTLEPGSYVLRFMATAGSTRIQRDVRFSIAGRWD